jgi:hypothetical protein
MQSPCYLENLKVRSPKCVSAAEIIGKKAYDNQADAEKDLGFSAFDFKNKFKNGEIVVVKKEPEGYFVYGIIVTDYFSDQYADVQIDLQGKIIGPTYNNIGKIKCK